MNATATIAPDPLVAALDYAGKSLPVFPCDPHNKRPLIDGGFKAASTDPDTVRAWWERWPDAMIGMPTGASTGFWALDIDDPEAFEKACPIDVPPTRRVDTGKGYHLYFRYDPAAPIRNHQRHPKRGWPFPELPGAETRGDGGYVIVPPSLHPSGRRYQWHDSSTVIDAPEALLSIIRTSANCADASPMQNEAGSDTHYGLAALESECDAIRRAGNGEQECALNEAALKIGALVAGGGLSIHTARAKLIAAGLAMPSYNSRDAWTPDKIVAKVERGLVDGGRSPRAVPASSRAEFPNNPVRERPAGRYQPTTREPEEARAQPSLLPLIDISAWEGAPPKRVSFWGDWLPANQTTMLTGRGGIGKSLFEQCLLTAIALGRPFLGMETVQRNTLYLTCEDDEAELWRRQDSINQAFGIDRAELVGKLFLCSLMGETDTALATFDATGRLTPTPRWNQLEHTCTALNITLYAFDNATDAMAGDLNDLHQVAEFVNLLTGLAKRMDGAAMILHHPNKAGEDWLGSVAWHNKVRSRLIIEDGEDDGDPDGRTIRNPKANYGPQGGKIAFRWYAGAFVREEDLGPDTAAQLRELSIANAQCDAFLACLRQRANEGVERAVGPASGPNYAPAQFEGMPEAKGFKRKALKGAMDRLFRMGRIATETVERPGKSGTKNIIVEVPSVFPNAPPNASRTRFPNGPERQPEHPREHTVGTTYHKGAAFEAAAPSDQGVQ